MKRAFGTSVAGFLVALAVTMAACGAGTPVVTVTVPSTIDVHVSAGSPVAGAIVTVYAISDATGEVDASAGQGGVLGTAGPTDSAGKVTVALSARGYSGPVQVVATGAALFYADPTVVPSSSSGPTLIQLPSSFVLSSYVTHFTDAQRAIPVTFLTTLGDHSALAFARGLHPAHPSTTTITEALASRDPLLVRHVTRGAGWDPSTFRTTIPAPLTAGPQSLVDVAFAGLFDVALNQLARDTSALAGYGPGAAGLDASALLELLEQDLDADARFDGSGGPGLSLRTSGAKPVAVDGQFLRLPLGRALQTWIHSEANRTALTEDDFIGAGIFSAIVEDRSDLFSPGPNATADVLVDKTPPVVSWAQLPPVAVAARPVTLFVSATDVGTGVKRVLAQVGPGAPVSGTLQQDGTWALSLLLDPGPNRIVVWAEDNAPLGANSGQFSSPPYQLTTIVFSDANAPTVLYNPAFVSYHDERGMTLARGAGGHATLPPTFVYAGAPVAIPPSGGHVYKAATRLSWASIPSATTLEDPVNGNPDNIPVLQFMVPFVQGVDAPVVDATYSVALACASCAFPPSSGALWLGSPAPNSVLYDLPLSANLIPALASLPGPATLTVTVSVTDAAGNTNTATPISLTFHTIGPPLVITEDLTYPGQRDPKSTYPYSIATGLYSTLFDATSMAFLSENAVRLVRYVVENPAAAPVALAMPSFSGGWRALETWVGDAGISLGTISYTVVNNSLCSAAPGCSGATPVSFGGGSAGGGCGASPPHDVTPSTDNPVVGAAALLSFAYNQAFGGDIALAQRMPSGQLIVPAASNGAPGLLAIYVDRPVSIGARGYVLPWLGTKYGYIVEDAWVKIFQGPSTCCEFDPELRRCLQFDSPTTWAGTRFSRTLASGVDAIDASFTLVTNGMAGGSAIGESTVVPGSVNVTRAIPH